MVSLTKRAFAALLVVSQLQLMALPALCDVAVQDAGACDRPIAPELPSAGVASAVAPCAFAALCAAPAAGFPESLLADRMVPRISGVADPGPRASHAAEPAAPLSPPPQA